MSMPKTGPLVCNHSDLIVRIAAASRRTEGTPSGSDRSICLEDADGVLRPSGSELRRLLPKAFPRKAMSLNLTLIDPIRYIVTSDNWKDRNARYPRTCECVHLRHTPLMPSDFLGLEQATSVKTSAKELWEKAVDGLTGLMDATELLRESGPLVTAQTAVRYLFRENKDWLGTVKWSCLKRDTAAERSCETLVSIILDLKTVKIEDKPWAYIVDTVCNVGNTSEDAKRNSMEHNDRIFAKTLAAVLDGLVSTLTVTLDIAKG